VNDPASRQAVRRGADDGLQLKAAFHAAARKSSETVRRNGAEPAFLVTWAYEDRAEMTARLAEAYTIALNENCALVIPVGLGRTRRLPRARWDYGKVGRARGVESIASIQAGQHNEWREPRFDPLGMALYGAPKVVKKINWPSLTTVLDVIDCSYIIGPLRCVPRFRSMHRLSETTEGAADNRATRPAACLRTGTGCRVSMSRFQHLNYLNYRNSE
jgi:hypothetical protein